MDARANETSTQGLVDTIYAESLCLGHNLVDLQPGVLDAQMETLRNLDYEWTESRLCPAIVSQLPLLSIISLRTYVRSVQNFT